MQRAGLPAAAVDAAEPYIWEGDATSALRKVRPYTLDYRRQVEGDVAKAAIEMIQRHAAAKRPFFVQVGWTYAHYPTLPSAEFQGKSRIGSWAIR